MFIVQMIDSSWSVPVVLARTAKSFKVVLLLRPLELARGSRTTTVPASIFKLLMLGQHFKFTKIIIGIA
jgi:hypothetical protein